MMWFCWNVLFIFLLKVYYIFKKNEIFNFGFEKYYINVYLCVFEFKKMSFKIYVIDEVMILVNWLKIYLKEKCKI